VSTPPDILEELDGIPDEQLRRIMLQLEAKGSLASFVEHMGFGYRPAAHQRLMIEKLEAVERGEITRLMLLLPPGSGKSSWTSQYFAAWFMGKNPQASILAISNKTEFAERWSRKVRNAVADLTFRQVFGFGLNEAVAAAGSWENEKGGEYHAAGMGSAIAGRRADLAIIDDPVPGREEADSERFLEKSWDWYQSDFMTRLKPGARQVLIMTRWSEADLGGRILEREAADWHIVKLPMEAVENDPLGRKPGERLWPEWFTEEMVERAKRDVRSWNALYQQDPVPDCGDYFKREWFAEFDPAKLPSSLRFYGASDYAVSEGRGDYTEHGVCAVDPLANLYVFAWWYGQERPDVWIERQCDMIEQHRPLIWFGESGVIRNATEGALKRRMIERGEFCRLEWLASIADKAVRARAIQARVSMGKVFLPKAARWKEHVLSQLLKFPAGKYDDAVDVLSLIGRGLEKVRPPSASDGMIRPPIPDYRYKPSQYSWMAG
jgi:predicted phage terminase large subunit-like protein